MYQISNMLNSTTEVLNDRTNKQILIYGQVQSGKTSKIMEYIKKSNVNITILVIQNSLSMLFQYEKTLSQNGIKFYSVSQNNVWIIKNYLRMNSTKNVVLIVMNNVYRKNALDELFSGNRIKQYTLIMDESDLYFDKIKDTRLYKNASECIHVTATPFIKEYKGYFDDVVIISPKKEYVSLRKLDIKYIPNVDCEFKTTINIINNDFLKSDEGIMLINIHNRISDMKIMCNYLRTRPTLLEVPIVLLSSSNILYFNGMTRELNKMSVSKIISGLEEHDHIIFIANRLSARGINYSNLSYTRHLTHQIIRQTGNSKTNFIQKCRILGNKEGLKDKLKLYCLDCDEDYMDELLEEVENVPNKSNEFKVGYVEEEKQKQKPSLVRSKTN